MGLRHLRAGERDGLWTPTLTIVTNLDAVTLLGAQFAIIGNSVLCSLAATVDPTSSSAFTFRASLPFGKVVDSLEDIIGVCGTGVVGFGGIVRGDPASDEALIDLSTGATGVSTMMAQWTYRLS